MNPIYNYNNNKEIYENLSHEELWDIWGEIKKTKLETLKGEEISNLSFFTEKMALSFNTVWLSLYIMDFIVTYTREKEFDDFFESDDSEKNIDSYQTHLKTFVEHSFATPLLKKLFEYMIIRNEEAYYHQ